MLPAIDPPRVHWRRSDGLMKKSFWASGGARRSTFSSASKKILRLLRKINSSEGAVDWSRCGHHHKTSQSGRGVHADRLTFTEDLDGYFDLFQTRQVTIASLSRGGFGVELPQVRKLSMIHSRSSFPASSRQPGQMSSWEHARGSGATKRESVPPTP